MNHTLRIANWYCNKEPIDQKRLIAYMYFTKAWSLVLNDPIDIDFYISNNKLTSKFIKKHFISKYGISKIPKQDDFDEYWLNQSIYDTYHELSTDEMYHIIENEPTFIQAKESKKYNHSILDVQLKKHYQYIYNNS